MPPTPVALGRDVRDSALGMDPPADGVGVVGPARHDQRAVRQVPQQRLGGPAIGRLARRQQEGERAAEAVAQGVDLWAAAGLVDTWIRFSPDRRP